MIDLYNLELEIGYGADGEKIEISRGEVLELIVRLRQAEKDAARYRWLRDEAADADQTSPLVFMADECAGIVTGIMFGKLLDAAIDEAMQCNK